MALTRSTDPLVWIDCEMTGLDHLTDRILSISCYITDADLNLLPPPLPLSSFPTPKSTSETQPGYHATILTPTSTLASMGPWPLQTHTATGLVALCADPAVSIPAPTAAAQLLAYIRTYVPAPRTALLAGNSVHVDRLFLLREPWGGVVEHLHYRILDVSAIKEGVRRWCGEGILRAAPGKKGAHTAESDVWESIEEARFYRGLLRGVTVGGLEEEEREGDGS